jgi:hypothetical protein
MDLEAGFRGANRNKARWQAGKDGKAQNRSGSRAPRAI